MIRGGRAYSPAAVAIVDAGSASDCFGPSCRSFATAGSREAAATGSGLSDVRLGRGRQ